MPRIRLLEIQALVVRTATRFPFRYGIAAMTAAPHLFLESRFEVDGRVVTGYSSEGLPPKWFVKSPDTTFDEDLPDMIEAIRLAIGAGIECGEAPGFAAWWRSIYDAQASWSASGGAPPLLAHLGTSLVERAGIDATCRALGTSFPKAVAENAFSLDLGDFHEELAGGTPATWLSPGQANDSTLSIRHTVGLADPLTDPDILDEDRVDDGLPQALDACIRAYGLRYFKIKLSGHAETDLERLRQLAGLLERESPAYRYTLDGNEQFRDLEGFRELWEALRADESLASFLSPDHLLFVEQPLHRDVALDADVGEALRAWEGAPPMIIDESDATLDSAREALALGYSGTSHKNCKGVLKGIANACLLRHRAQQQPGQPWILSGEDLANIGPVALFQDLAVMHTLGITHVERNGHHYFSGLGMYEPSVQEAVLSHHGDLYREHRGFPTLAIDEGTIALGSVLEAPFGTGFAMGALLTDWTSLEALVSGGAFAGY